MMNNENHEPEWSDAPAAGTKRRTGAVVLIGVICVAIGAILAMRFLPPDDIIAVPPELEAGVNEILEREAKNPFNPEAIIEVLPKSPVVSEVERPRNPFPGTRPEPPPRSDKEMRRREISAAASRLRLNAIMTGSNPVASVSGRGLQLGEVIEVPAEEGRARVAFRVASISKTAVTLVAEDPDLDLRVETTLHLNQP
ncbi:MAG: hypothetical protein ACYS5V_17265 [Planctomycetota bacterium]|jgi:hypothetical protein